MFFLFLFVVFIYVLIAIGIHSDLKENWSGGKIRDWSSIGGDVCPRQNKGKVNDGRSNE
jgi:hypothetical protein